MGSKNYSITVFNIFIVLFFSFASIAGAEVTGKIWKPLPLRTEKQADRNMFGGEGMQMIFSISYAPSNSEVVYFVTDTSGVWRGEWTIVGTKPDPGPGEDPNEYGFFWESKRGTYDNEHKGFRSKGGISLVVDPSNENVVYVSGSRNEGTNTSIIDGIYRTTDGGDSWELVYPTAYYRNKEGQHFIFSPRESDVVCDLPDNKCHHQTVYAATHSDGIWKSTDGGNEGTWERLSGTEGKWITDLEIRPGENMNLILYAAAKNDGLYKIIDTGSLVTVTSIGNLPSYPRTIALNQQVVPGDDIIYAAVGTDKVYKSTDGGQTFTKKDNGLSVNNKEYKIIDISSADPDYLYVSVDAYAGNNPFYSHDGGETWTQPSDIDEGGLSIDSGYYFASSTATNPLNSGEALHGFAGKDRVAITENGGSTWKYSGNGYMGGYRTRNKTSSFFDSQNPDRYIFFLLDYGPAVTNDNGDTWKLLEVPWVNGAKSTPAGAAFNNNTTDPSDDIIITAIGKWSSQKIARSINGGDTWTVFDGTEGTVDINGNFNFLMFHPQDNNIVYAGAKGESWISRNSGASWENVSAKNIRAVFPGNGDIIYAIEKCSGDNTPIIGCKSWYSILYRSEDQGINWDYVTINPFAWDILDIDIDPFDSNRLYAVFWDVYVYNGTEWQKTGKCCGMPVEDFEGENSFQVHNIAVDPNNEQIVYAGMWAPARGFRDDFIYRSIDRGTTWENIGMDLEYSEVHSLAVNPANSVLYMNTAHGNYSFCTDNDGDGYAVEGGPCGSVDSDDTDPSTYRIEDLYAHSQSNKIKLTWSCILTQPGANYYNIYRSTFQGGPYELIKGNYYQTEDCKYFDDDNGNGLPAGITSYYVVRWKDINGHESADSNEAGATPH